MPKPEGMTFPFKGEKEIKADLLEIFPFDAKDEFIRTETKEFSAVCPFSGLPDIGHVIIEYYPDGGVCVELKSLKYYLISYRNVGIYQEAATKKIYEDLKKVLKTDRLRVTTIYNIRGGFLTTVICGSLEGTPPHNELKNFTSF